MANLGLHMAVRLQAKVRAWVWPRLNVGTVWWTWSLWLALLCKCWPIACYYCHLCCTCSEPWCCQ